MTAPSCIVRVAIGPLDYAAIAQLIQEYVAWMLARYEQDNWLITELLDKQSLAPELENLSTIYGAPNGRAFVAVADGEFRGCGAYRRLDDGVCEMKRVFIPQRFQGAGIGRKLCNALVTSARNEGFRVMRLDTGNRMTEAISLYESIGFEKCPPYSDYPQKFLPYLVFMELSLVDSRADDH